MVFRGRFHRGLVVVLLPPRQERILRRSMEARIRQLGDCPRMPIRRRFSMRRSTRISDTRRRIRRGHSRIQMLHNMRMLVLGMGPGLGPGQGRAVIVLPRFLRRFQLLLRRQLASIGRMSLPPLSHQAVR